MNSTEKDINYEIPYNYKEIIKILNDINPMPEAERIAYCKKLTRFQAEYIVNKSIEVNESMIVCWTRKLFYEAKTAEEFFESKSIMEKVICDYALKTPSFGFDIVMFASNAFEEPKFGEPDIEKAEYYYRLGINIMTEYYDDSEKYVKLYDVWNSYEWFCNLYYYNGNIQKANDIFAEAKEKGFVNPNIDVTAYKKLVNQENNSNIKKELEQNGCYVATCVYGSYNCPQVWTLRRYRDNQLAKTWYGRAFINTYYAISPTLVKWFGNTQWFKNMWKPKLDSMVKELQESGVESTPYEDKNWK